METTRDDTASVHSADFEVSGVSLPLSTHLDDCQQII